MMKIMREGFLKHAGVLFINNNTDSNFQAEFRNSTYSCAADGVCQVIVHLNTLVPKVMREGFL